MITSILLFTSLSLIAMTMYYQPQFQSGYNVNTIQSGAYKTSAEGLRTIRRDQFRSMSLWDLEARAEKEPKNELLREVLIEARDRISKLYRTDKPDS